MNFRSSSLILAILIFSVFYITAIQNGLNMTADSHHYLAISKQIYQNGLISIWKNEQLVYWPPLYPFILSLLEPISNLQSVKVLNYVLFLLLIAIWNKIASNILERGWYHSLFLILLALCTPLLMISTFIWSELIFLAFFSLIILLFERFLNTRNIIWIWISVIPAFLMLLQRNAGIFLITPLYISSFLFGQDLRKYLWHYLYCYCFSILGFLIWNIKNILIENRLYMVGELVPYFVPFKNIRILFTELGNLVFPAQLFYPISILISVAVFAVVGWVIFKYSENSRIKVILLTCYLYLAIWMIIPGDPSNMGRFISVVTPGLLLAIVYCISLISKNMKISVYVRKISISLMIMYCFLRIANNALLWGGQDSVYINLGKYHENIFYEKSKRTIGRPSK